MQGSINNHIVLLKAILSAEEAKNYNEALSKLYKSDNAIVQHIRMIQESIHEATERIDNIDKESYKEVLEQQQLQFKMQLEQKESKDRDIIAYYKGKLIQFLKNVQLTDLKNEELLKIIQRWMEFTPNEISELYNQRASLKVNSQNED